jgi:hypothetical protein
LSQSDPTDNALAAIASILDQPETHREPEKVVKVASETGPAASGPIEADGYSKVGPGPMEAIRFKWTVRRDANGSYFVDETIGNNSRPIASGPMSAEDAIKFVDAHESEARRQFENLRSEMTGRASSAKVVRKNSGEM